MSTGLELEDILFYLDCENAWVSLLEFPIAIILGIILYWSVVEGTLLLLLLLFRTSPPTPVFETTTLSL